MLERRGALKIVYVNDLALTGTERP